MKRPSAQFHLSLGLVEQFLGHNFKSRQCLGANDGGALVDPG